MYCWRRTLPESTFQQNKLNNCLSGKIFRFLENYMKTLRVIFKNGYINHILEVDKIFSIISLSIYKNRKPFNA